MQRRIGPGGLEEAPWGTCSVKDSLDGLEEGRGHIRGHDDLDGPEEAPRAHAVKDSLDGLEDAPRAHAWSRRSRWPGGGAGGAFVVKTI